MRAVSLGTLLLATANGLSMSGLGGDTTETLILWQVLRNGGDMGTQMSMMPLLMSQLFDDNQNVMGGAGLCLHFSMCPRFWIPVFANPDFFGLGQGDSDIQQLLLMNAFSNPDMQQWLPFILFSDKNMQDKLLMMQYLQMMESQGEPFPRLILA